MSSGAWAPSILSVWGLPDQWVSVESCPPTLMRKGGRKQKGSSRSVLRAYLTVLLMFKEKNFLISSFLHFDNCVECCGHMTLVSVSYIYFCPHLGEINLYRQNILNTDCSHQGQVFFYIFQIMMGIQQLLSAVDVLYLGGRNYLTCQTVLVYPNKSAVQQLQFQDRKSFVNWINECIPFMNSSYQLTPIRHCPPNLLGKMFM